ncbi:hypothetical protein GCM10023310_16670 [Paenibacillus vulneris]|uniref:Bacterial Pleckstrin homology domain-containing protein n=1 Tax=Paenibacillus vulneris TaxID=1133364 RepID=A0ABW3ULZ3_9BACL|nr:hypothetical protein [Paenibacillus sp. 32352]
MAPAMKQGRLIAAIVFLGLFAVSLGAYLYLQRGTPASPQALMVQQVHMDDGKLQLTGTTSHSAAGFSGYSYKRSGGDMYVKLRYSILSSSGDFSITIPAGQEAVRNVYLQGSSPDDLRLLWSQ